MQRTVDEQTVSPALFRAHRWNSTSKEHTSQVDWIAARINYPVTPEVAGGVHAGVTCARAQRVRTLEADARKARSFTHIYR